ncbi:MAG TPA: Ni/Fe hydrogenase subunit alpha [Bacteroidales bacterium]|nr:Ni/Fe hydrogenase subunit alpha [Bacteroidales bacterium]HSA44306.1 Ni/Fe hydrogenase subunit alpha [Bacteroidales bacterium]
MKQLTIDPITRLEGHGKIEIFLSDEGEVDNVFFQVPELRGFEKFLEGRPAEEVPQIVTKICGVCPGCHHMASGKAVDMIFGLQPTATAAMIRELFYMAHFVHSHIAHFYALAAPDFVCGPDTPKAERNILGVIAKVGADIGTEVIRQRRLAQEIQALLGGHQTHVMLNIPGGVRKGLTAEQRDDIVKTAGGFVEFARFSLRIFEDVVLANKDYVDMILQGPYKLRLYSMGLVDSNNHVNFYDGHVRVVDPDGREHCRYQAVDYREYVSERVETWSYLKFPFLKKVGWKGFTEGNDSGVYHATPLSRLNAAEGMATPLAMAEYNRMFSVIGVKPVHNTLAMHWARLVELLYSAERCLELAMHPDITGSDLRTPPDGIAGEGVGIVEAQRGTLTHHYWTDEKGLITRANIIVGTTNNNAAICMSIKKAAQGYIRKGVTVDEGILNRIEMAFRAYDPCFSCATHSLPGNMPMIVNLRSSSGELLRQIRRDL